MYKTEEEMSELPPSNENQATIKELKNEIERLHKIIETQNVVIDKFCKS